VTAALPPHIAESLWLSGMRLKENAGEAQPRQLKQKWISSVRQSLTALCGGEAAKLESPMTPKAVSASENRCVSDLYQSVRARTLEIVARQFVIAHELVTH